MFVSDGKKKYIPIEQVDALWVFGEVTMNKRFIELASEKEICVHFFNYYGYYVGTFYPREHLNSGYVILKQAEFYNDDFKRLYLAKSIIQTAVSNILNNLRYYKSRGKRLEVFIDDIEKLYANLDDCESINQIMAYEGNMRAIYYQAFNKILDDKDFAFEKRTRMPPLDSINALISFGNSLMYTTVLGQIYQTHLDPRIGYLHTTNSRKFSLNLDIAEIFKPVIVDRVIFSLINKNIITRKDFSQETRGIMLNENGRKKFISEYEKKLMTTIKHPNLSSDVTYKRLIKLELYKVQRLIVEGESYNGFKARW